MREGATVPLKAPEAPPPLLMDLCRHKSARALQTNTENGPSKLVVAAVPAADSRLSEKERGEAESCSDPKAFSSTRDSHR